MDSIVLCKSCFERCGSLSSITFESDSHLQRIEKSAFEESGLKSIVISSSIEVLCESCFEECKSLSSITFGIDSHLQCIEKYAFLET
jgi:NAD-dependent dihydropyrimidine dehydrogenase PreA subunit